MNPPSPTFSAQHNYARKVVWTIFAVGILYYCFAYLCRIYPSVMEPNLLGRFSITASSFGILTSFYYFAYAPMQLPVGMAVDFIGVRRSLLAACFISTTGALIFSLTKSFGLSLFARFLIGFGTAFAYVSALKIASLYLPKKYFATATGMVTGAGMVAAIFTDMYLTHIVQTYGFAHAMIFPVIMGVMLFILIFLFIRKPKNTMARINDKQPEKNALSFKQLLSYLKVIIRNKQMWYISLVGALLYLPSTVFIDVWGIPYLETAHHLSAQTAALGVSVMLTGWIISSFTTGALSDIWGNRKSFIMCATMGAAILSACLLYLPNLSSTLLFSLLFLIGIFCGPHPLCFTMSKENNDTKIAGTAVSFANFIIMMGGFIFQPAVGELLDANWHGKMHNGIRIYSAHNYSLALSILPIGLLLATLITFRIKETTQNKAPVKIENKTFDLDTGCIDPDDTLIENI